MLSPYTWSLIWGVLIFALGWMCHMGWQMLVRWHDADKDRKISLYEREIFRLRAQLDAHGGIPGEEAPMPMTDADPVPMPLDEPSPAAIPAAPAPRKRRSPVKGQITPLEPSKADTKKVPPSIPQADLGRMQAQLNAYGRCRTVYAGGTKH
jgi:hypothetical protein